VYTFTITKTFPKHIRYFPSILPIGKMDFQTPQYLVPLNMANQPQNTDTAKQNCPHCPRSFSRGWTLKRHIQTQHQWTDPQTGGGDTESDRSESSVSETSATETEGTATSEDEHSEQLELSHEEVNKIRNLIALGELGDIKLTKNALIALVPGNHARNFRADSDDSDESDSYQYQFGKQALTVLREMLTAAKRKHIILTRRLFFDIIDSLDLSHLDQDDDDDQGFKF